MSRAWLPRRILARIQILTAALAMLAATPIAHAQDPGSQASSLTVLGNDSHMRRCTGFFAAGNISDQAVEMCTRALTYPRLTREGAVEIHTDRGIIYLRRHEGDEALADFNAVLAIDPQNA